MAGSTMTIVSPVRNISIKSDTMPICAAEPMNPVRIPSKVRPFAFQLSM